MLIEMKHSTEPIYASALAKIVDCTYSHVVKILEDFRREEIITYERKGRRKLLFLTAKGKLIAEHLIQVKENL